MPVFAAMGAECTVLDYSASQIASERLVAEREGYRIATVRADMTKPLPFGDEAFDLVFHPVSNCYIEEVLPVWRECFRVLAPGGRLLAGLDNGFNYTVDDDERRIIRGLPFNPLRDPSLIPPEDLPEWGMQFSHTLDEQIRGQNPSSSQPRAVQIPPSRIQMMLPIRDMAPPFPPSSPWYPAGAHPRTDPRLRFP